jgi:hypothetical protein
VEYASAPFFTSSQTYQIVQSSSGSIAVWVQSSQRMSCCNATISTSTDSRNVSVPDGRKPDAPPPADRDYRTRRRTNTRSRSAAEAVEGFEYGQSLARIVGGLLDRAAGGGERGSDHMAAHCGRTARYESQSGHRRYRSYVGM